jgi:glycosyltransferase involved in cell wall biosynthesis
MSAALSETYGTVSVVIPAWRATGTIGRAVRSCLDDTAAVDEIIVVLDGLDDELHAAVPDDARVRVLTQAQTRGAPAARNAGLAAASGEFVLFLDADDFIEDGLIASLVDAAREADLAFGPYAFAFPSGRRIPVNVLDTIRQPTVAHVLKAWFAGYYVPSCSVLWRTSFVRAIGGWNVGLLKNQDGELVWRACRAKARLALAAKGCGVYMQSFSPGRVSANRSRAMYEQQLALFTRVESDLPRALLSQVAAELGGMYYRLARTAYYNDVSDVGWQAERAARRLGAGDHDGTLPHRMVSRLIGLESKERFSARLHRARDAVGLMPPPRDLVPIER